MNKEIMYFYISSLVTLVVLVIISILLILKRRKIYILLGLYIFTTVISSIAIPCIKDWNNALNEKYETISGYAQNNSESSKGLGRALIIQSEDEKITVHVRTKRIQKGDYFEVKYLHHTKFGIVVRRN